jgi:hypothetical protein
MTASKQDSALLFELFLPGLLFFLAAFIVMASAAIMRALFRCCKQQKMCTATFWCLAVRSDGSFENTMKNGHFQEKMLENARQ